MGTNKLKQTHQSFTPANKQIKVLFGITHVEASNTAIWLRCWMRRPDDEAASRQTKPIIWNNLVEIGGGGCCGIVKSNHQ